MNSSRRTFIIGAGQVCIIPFLSATPNGAEVQLPVSLAHAPIPTFANGAVAFIDVELRSVVVIDLSGKVLGKITPHISGASAVRVASVAIAPDRTLAIAMSAKDASDRYSSFLVFGDCSGQQLQIVQTHPFGIRRLTYLPNGQLLCLGREYDTQFVDIPKHHVLRFYDSKGVLTKTALDVSTVRSGSDPHQLNWSLVTGQDRIGLVDGEGHRYGEIGLDGKFLVPMEDLGIEKSAMITGLVLLPNGDRLVTIDRPRLQGGTLRYGFACEAHQISGTAKATRLISSRPDLLPADSRNLLSAVGYHDGKIVLLCRNPDRLVLHES